MNEQSGRTGLFRVPIIVGVAVLLLFACISAALNLADGRRNSANCRICISNLSHLRAAKHLLADEKSLRDGATVSWNDLQPYLGGTPLRCPDGGTYLLQPVGTDPQCTFTNIVRTYFRQGLTLRPSSCRHRLP